MERERKFLVETLPANLARYPHDLIRQGYLARTRGDLEFRLRQRGKSRQLTVKSGRGVSRLETEIPVSISAWRTLWPLTRGRRLEKVRYVIPYRGHRIELDRYRGRLRGLFTAEVEFASSRSLARFVPPQWFGREITGNVRYSNWALAAHGPTSRKTNRVLALVPAPASRS
jgi:adenylate cyclase